MQCNDLHVRNVRGRYPRNAQLRSDNIVARVVKCGSMRFIRLDDAENQEMWLEIVVEVETAEVRIPCSP